MALHVVAEKGWSIAPPALIGSRVPLMQCFDVQIRLAKLVPGRMYIATSHARKHGIGMAWQTWKAGQGRPRHSSNCGLPLLTETHL